MGQITGNDKDFPTIKQVNEALGSVVGGNTELDISEYVYELFMLKYSEYDGDDNTIGKNEYFDLTNSKIIEMLEKIIEVKPSILKGKGNIGGNENLIFNTSNIKWCETTYYTTTPKFIISFKIYGILMDLSYHFSFIKQENDSYKYSRYTVDLNGF